jgi:hypothetical protein
MGLQRLTVGQLHRMMIQTRVQRRHLLGNHFQVVGLGVLGKFHGKLGPADMGETGIVFHFVAHGHLAAGDTLFHQDGLEGRPHGIDGCGQPARPTADDYQIIKITLCHR